ncbi:hypothetical protein ILUMI_05124 [Ignelater luminosus]|uniref:Uncharacterized protein n=1 Tax=Ignelater luminosus TaxID=2038154 RepID=A0A8K0DD64_IGNLU|nr:hypothetical protein ILUMI_05124 [Ignelater luminosus]
MVVGKTGINGYEMVKKRTPLWDLKDFQHHNRYVLDKLWDGVAKEVKSTNDSVSNNQVPLETDRSTLTTPIHASGTVLKRKRYNDQDIGTALMKIEEKVVYNFAYGSQERTQEIIPPQPYQLHVNSQRFTVELQTTNNLTHDYSNPTSVAYYVTSFSGEIY